MKILYRISDGGNPKYKPDYVTKRGCFLHFLKRFEGYDIYVIADNVSDDTYLFLQQHATNVIRTSLGNKGAFMYAIDYAIQHFDTEEKVYLAEDDYVYTQKAPRVLEEGLDIADYCSGYDHPDKYINYNDGGPNPFIHDGGETTRVMLTQSTHWKITNSFCLTFGAKVSTLQKDYEVFKHGTNNFGMFCELNSYRRLVSCIPSVSTHGEVQWLAKLIDWEKEFYSISNMETNTIYCFWTGDNPMNEKRIACLKHSREVSKCNIVLVTKKELDTYILKDHPLHPAYHYLSETHKSDYLRAYFAHFHGGGYMDVKKTLGNWVECFNELTYNDHKWICGYRMQGDGQVAYIPNKPHWYHLIGVNGFICKSQTSFTKKWYEELLSILDGKLEQLKQCPAKYTDDGTYRNSGYPIEWSELLGNIFHKLVYEYKDKVSYTLPNLNLDLNDYR